MSQAELDLRVESRAGVGHLHFPVRRLVCAGWVGRDESALREHIKELGEHGVPAPTRIPIYLNFSRYLATTSDLVEVVSTETSGEVEYVILKDADLVYVGVGSDHTDRGFERYSIPASKQMYPKVVAPLVWPYDEVRDHWDSLVLRSWTTTGETRVLYQEAELATILNAEELLDGLPREDGLSTEVLVLFSGTPATRSGLIFGDSFEFELEDPVLVRAIRHGYRVRVLPQYG